MQRSSMIMGGTVLGAAAVMVMPRPSTPQQVAIAGNAGATRAKHAAQSSNPASAPATTTHTTAAPKPKPKPKPAAPAVKTVVGSLATDQYGQLQVKLTVKNNRITNVGFTSFIANDGHSMQIDQYAAPILIRETIAAQSAHIQGVSGATYTSNEYMQSLQSAIDKAGL